MSISQPDSFFNPYKRQAEAIRNRQRGSVPSPSPVQSKEPLPTAQNFGPEPTNVMEMLVTMEVVKQVQALPKPLQEFVKMSQVKAYALNILPPLYVTSAKGWERQWERGKNELFEKVQMAVRQGIAAVRRDPLREMTALPHERVPIAESALNQIQRILGDDALTWYTVIPALRRALRHSQRAKQEQRERAFHHVSQVTSVSPPSQASQVTTRQSVVQEDRELPPETFDWDAHPLHQRGW